MAFLKGSATLFGGFVHTYTAAKETIRFKLCKNVRPAINSTPEKLRKGVEIG